MISDTIINLLNYRIEQEEYSSRLYWAMGQWLDYRGYVGGAALWKYWAKEETEHAEWVYDYLQALDIKPMVPALEKPPCDYESISEIILTSIEHEEEVTRQCQELAEAALTEKDFLTYTLAEKFVKEQVEELSKLYLLRNKLREFGTEPVSLKLLDKELGKMVP